MKRIFAIATALALAISVLVSVPANASTHACTSGTFTVTDTVVTGNSNCTGAVSIPAGVTEIGPWAFGDMSLSSDDLLTSVTLPEGLQIIDQYAFFGQRLITSITIPSSVEDIGFGAFQWARSLSTVTFAGLDAPEVRSSAFFLIGDSPTAQIQSRAQGFAMNGSSYFGLNVVRAAEAGFIADGTFDCATGARQSGESEPNIRVEGGTTKSGYSCIGPVVVPNGVIRIGSWSMGDGSGPTTVTLPNSVTTIDPAAFAYSETITSVNIPNSVTSIGAEAFYNSDALVTITIPASVVTLGEEVFYGADSLTSVVFQGEITSIPARTFREASSLSSVTIPNSVTSIGEAAFSRTGLTSVSIPSSVTSIGDYAFERTSLTSVTIPNSVTSIGDNAFERTSLTSATIPNSVTSIGDYVFNSSALLTSVTLPDGITEIPSGIFFGTGLTSFDIPSTVTEIMPSAFAYSQLRSISIPNSVTRLGQSAFQGTALTSISIPQGVTTIESYLVDSATSLTSITIPNNVDSIGVHAFRGATSLTSIYFMGNPPTSVDPVAFEGVNTATAKVRLQPGNTGFGSSWNGFAVVGAVEDGTYACSTGLPAISGARYTIINRVVSLGSTCSGAVFVPPGITTIAASAFDGASSMTSITLPSTVTSLGQRSFAGATALTGVTIPSSVTSIGASAFAGATSLSSVKFMGNAPATVGLSAFSGVANAAQARVYLGVTGFGNAGSLWNGLVITPPVTQGQSQNQNQNQNNTLVAAPLPPAFNIRPFAVLADSKTLNINGSNLSDVSSIKIAGKVVKIGQRSNGNIVIDVPELAEGKYDVEITHATGVIRIQDVLQVVKPYELKRTQTLTRFKGNLPTAASLAALKKLYLQDTSANVVYCFATVASNASARAVSRATAQAKAACEAAQNFSVRRMSLNVRVEKTAKVGAKASLAVTFDRTLTGN